MATDIDLAAMRMARSNAAANGVAARIALVIGPGSVGQVRGRFDLVLANIQVRPLAALAPAVARRIGRGGYVVLSGLLRGHEDEALAAYRAQGLALGARLPLGDWVDTRVARKRDARAGVICRPPRRACLSSQSSLRGFP